MKHSDDLQQIIKVPAFAGCDNVNMCELDGEWYWITDYRENAVGEVRYVLDWSAPTSCLLYGEGLMGAWERVPQRTRYYLKETISEKPMIYELNVLDDGLIHQAGDRLGSDILYVQVSGYNASNELKMIGGFIRCDPSSGLVINQAAVQEGATSSYPTYDDLIEHLADCTGIEAERVLDLSVSPRCPWRVETVGSYYRLYGANSPSVQSAYGFMYDILNDNVPKDAQYRTWTDTIVLTDAPELCTMSIRDYNGNAILNVNPPESDVSVDAQGRYSFDIWYSTVADVSGIYTEIGTASGVKTVITEPKLPFISNTWDTYKAFQMEGDRTVMENAIRYASEQARIDKDNATSQAISGAVGSLTTAAIMAPFSGGASLVAAGAGLAGTGASLYTDMLAIDRKRDMEQMQARDTFELSRIQALDQPQTAYQAPYGTIGCYWQMFKPIGIGVSFQYEDGYDDPDAALWFRYFGHRSEGVGTVQLEEGYIRGQMLMGPDSSLRPIYGKRYDELVRTMSLGIRIKKIPEDNER